MVSEATGRAGVSAMRSGATLRLVCAAAPIGTSRQDHRATPGSKARRMPCRCLLPVNR
ncbi:hypothetical protein D9M68_581720 [compost metagenome]